jgi:hypothetical protein
MLSKNKFEYSDQVSPLYDNCRLEINVLITLPIGEYKGNNQNYKRTSESEHVPLSF